MNICIITTEYVSENPSGGIAHQFHRIARWLSTHGHVVRVVTLSADHGMQEHEGIEVYRHNPHQTMIYRVLNSVTMGRFSGTIAHVVYMYQAYAAVKRLSRHMRCDIIDSTVFRGCGLLAYLLLPIPHICMITSYRPVWDPIPRIVSDLDGKALELLEKLVLHVCRHFYIPSRALKTLIEEQEKISIEAVVPTPFYQETAVADESLYNAKLQGKTYLLYAGRFQMHKGAHILADALPAVLARFPQLHAVFIGRDATTQIGSMHAYIRNACGAFSDRIMFLEPMSHDRLYPLMRHARVIVIPSLMDNLPNVLLEAVGLGKTVIGTRGTSCDEVITDAVSGFIVPPGNVPALATALTDVLGRSDLSGIERHAREEARRFAPDSVIPALLACFTRVIERTGLPGNGGAR